MLNTGDAPKSRGRKDDPKHDAWQRRVIEIAIQHGFSCEHIYHTRDSRGSQKGYPDLHMLNLGAIRSVCSLSARSARTSRNASVELDARAEAMWT